MVLQPYKNSKNDKGFHVCCETRNDFCTKWSSKLGLVLGFKIQNASTATHTHTHTLPQTKGSGYFAVDSNLPSETILS